MLAIKQETVDVINYANRPVVWVCARPFISIALFYRDSLRITVFYKAAEWPDRPPLRIAHRISENLQKDRLGEAVEQRDGLAALLPELIGLIQDRHNPLLLVEGWQGNRQRCKASLVQGHPHYSPVSLTIEIDLF